MAHAQVSASSQQSTLTAPPSSGLLRAYGTCANSLQLWLGEAVYRLGNGGTRLEPARGSELTAAFAAAFWIEGRVCRDGMAWSYDLGLTKTKS